ncbi:hypothetical protein GCM10008110_18830 [Marinobacter persicus]|nr:hypothetical protein GCM10008110_18830 [Marinobacter persicus]
MSVNGVLRQPQLSFIVCGDDLLRPQVEGHTFFSEGDAIRIPLKQRRANLTFKLLHLPADRRLGQEKSFSCPRKTARIRNIYKCT